MKRIWGVVEIGRIVLICLLLFAVGAGMLAGIFPVFGQSVESKEKEAGQYDGDEILLSWTEDSAHSQTISWHSKEGKEGYVQYSRKGQKLSEENQVKAQITEVGEGGYLRYTAVIKGLSRQSVYRYRIGDGETWSEIRSFKTAPAAPSKEDGTTASDQGSSFEFLYLGDVQYLQRTKDYPAWGKMLQDIGQRNPGIAFGLTGGDMVNSSRKMEDWHLFLEQASTVFSRIPMMTTIGNHETSVKADFYMQIMALPQNGPRDLSEEFYSFDYGGCHITVLNTSFFLENRKVAEGERWQEKLDAVNQWLSEDLENTGADWRIIAMHHPAYGISDEDPIYEQIRTEWEPIFEQGKADLVFCGHQHLYMRTKEIGGITYIMGNSGKRRSTWYNGENAPDYSRALDAVNTNYQIVRVSSDQLSVASYDEEGQLIDKWTKERKKTGVWKAAGAAGGIMLLIAVVMFLSLRKWKGRTF